jgi:Ni2+-binding GTPase involved in maturation of urease and hydrogenase
MGELGCKRTVRPLNEIRPGIRAFETSAKTGKGMGNWLNYLARERG